MARPSKLEDHVVDAWLSAHTGWQRIVSDNGRAALERRYAMSDFSTALAFAVRLGLLAEKRDHHPDVLVGWGKAAVVWSTHDAGGVTSLDLELAEATDALAAGTGR